MKGKTHRIPSTEVLLVDATHAVSQHHVDHTRPWESVPMRMEDEMKPKELNSSCLINYRGQGFFVDFKRRENVNVRNMSS